MSAVVENPYQAQGDQAEKPPAILLMGPTASGKTALAQHLCDSLNGAIINVDSAQFYRHMDIGSAKPDAQTLAKYPHRMIDFLDPSESYSVAQFARDVQQQIAEVLAEGKLPLLVGGSMLYFKVLVDGINDMPQTDERLRQRLEKVRAKKGLDYLHRWLSRVDPVAGARLHPNDPQRILRALEVYLLSGHSLSAHHASPQQPYSTPCNWLSVVLLPQRRELLHQVIAQRFERMLNEGFLAEVEALYRRGDLSLAHPAMRAVGYRQIWMYLEGAIAYASMKERGIIATRQFAKRQYTWLRSWISTKRNVFVFDNSNVLDASTNEQDVRLAQLHIEVLTYLSKSLK